MATLIMIVMTKNPVKWFATAIAMTTLTSKHCTMVMANPASTVMAMAMELATVWLMAMAMPFLSSLP